MVPGPRRGELVRLLGEELRREKETLGALVPERDGKHAIKLIDRAFATDLDAIKAAKNVLRVPRNVLMPVILLFCVVGAFAINNSVFDIGVMLAPPNLELLRGIPISLCPSL